jgi:RNA polymerase sigma factor (sigma-70 family)
MEMAEWVKAAQAGDREAFGELVRRFQDMAYAAAYARLRDHQHAQDAAQDAFIAAYTSLPKLQQPDAFPGWFRSIVFHQCARILRKKVDAFLPLEAADELSEPESQPLERAMENETKDQVREAVLALPEHERIVTHLFYIGGHSLKDISTFLDIPVATVKTRLHAARKHLKARLMTMIQEDLQAQRPSRDDAFSNKILHVADALSIRTFSHHATYQISSDGNYLAYVIQQPGQEEGTSQAYRSFYLTTGAPGWVVGCEVWVQPLPNGKPQRLTLEHGSDWSPRWSPDGRHLAFYSDRSGSAQLWVWDRQTNEERLVCEAATRAHGGWEGPQWTPDGASLLVRIPPEKTQALSDEERLEEPSQDVPVVWSHDPTAKSDAVHEPNQTGRAWPASAENFRSVLARIDVGTGKVQRLTEEIYTYAWTLSPDGKSVAYLQFDGTAGSAHFYLWELMLVPLNGSEPRTLAQKVPQMSGVSFSWSPDGAYLAYFDSDLQDAWIVPAQGGEPVNLTAAHPEIALPSYTEGRPMWSADSRSLFFLGEGSLWQISVDGEKRKLTPDMEKAVTGVIPDGDRSVLWSPDKTSAYLTTFHSATKHRGVLKLNLETGHVERLYKASAQLFGFKGCSGKAAKPSRIYFIQEDATHPPDLWAADLAFTSLQQTTRLNPHLEPERFQSPRLIEWTVEDGRTLRGALLLPKGLVSDSTKYPVVVFLYPGSNLSDSLNCFGLMGANRGNLHILVSQGYGVMMIDAPLQTNDPLKELPGLILPGLDQLVELGIADPKRFAVMGHSYGGYAVNCLITQTSRFKAAVSSAGVSDLVSMYLSVDKDGSSDRNIGWSEYGQGRMEGTLWEQKQRYIENSPAFHLEKVETPLLLLHGEEDVLPPPAQSKEMFAGLRRLDKSVSLVLYPGEGHHYVQHWRHASISDYWGRILEWFDRYL